MLSDTIKLEEVILRADSGFQRWKNIDIKVRIQAVRSLRKTVQKKAQTIAKAISAEGHRPLNEALTQEVLPVLEMAKYCEKNYRRWLLPKRSRYRRPGFFRKENILRREPVGIVAVFSPRNFPFSLGMMTLIYTVLAGNTVILKPSEKSQLLPALIEQLLNESGLTALGAGILILGGAEIGEKLIRHPSIQKIIFFGHRKSGEKIARACIRHSKPFVLESGGGSTAFVLKDANLDLAARGLAWSAFYANGQSCVSTERIIVDRKIEEEFLLLFKKKVKTILDERMQNSPKLEFADSDQIRYEELIKDAKSKSADIYSIGENNGDKPSTSPSCLTVVNTASPSNKIWNKEIFGPLVAIMSVDNVQMAALNMNRESSPLGVSIWSEDRKKAISLAKDIQAGMIWINDSSFGLPHLPWGGWGKSGWGTLFSEHSLHEVTRVKWVSRHPARWAKPRMWWNPYTPFKEKILLKTARHFF